MSLHAHTELAARLGLPPARLVLGVVSAAACVVWLVPLQDELTFSIWVARISVCIAFIAAAVVAAGRRRGVTVPALMFLFAFAYAGGAAVQDELLPWRYTAGLVFLDLDIALLALLVLTFPSGRLSSWPARAVGAGFVLVILGWKPLELLYAPPAALCATCPPAGNLFFTGAAPFDFGSFEAAIGDARNALLVALCLFLGARLVTATGPARRALAPVAIPAMAYSGKVVVDATWLEDEVLYPADVFLLISAPNAVLLAAVAAGLLLGLSRASGWHGPLGRLLVDLQGAPDGAIRDVLARSLNDRTLQVGYWARPLERFVDEQGEPVDLTSLGPDRATTMVNAADGPLAVLVHDPAILEHGGFLESVTAAAQLALENERLKAQIRAQLADVTRSRARIVEATDTARRKLERDLHDGAQQHLVGLRVYLRSVRTAARERGGDAELDRMFERLDEQVKDALAEMRNLAHGIHPAILSEEGLAAALETLAGRAPCPVTLRAVPEGRLPPAIEIAAYFVCSEAVANAAKHASAEHVTIGVALRNGIAHVRVEDDGTGGADVSGGSGLRGLSDRVEAIGGRLVVDSPPGRGTRIDAAIPVKSQG